MADGKMKVEISDVAGIWRNGTEKPDIFSVTDMMPILSDFFRHKLKDEILTQKNYDDGYQEQDWRFSENCVGCRWFDQCKEETRMKRTMSALGNK